MRLRNLKSYPLKKKKIVEDEELNKVTSYEEVGIIQADIQPMSGKVQAEIYGTRMAYMAVAYTHEKLTEENAITYNNADYKVAAIKPWESHFVIDLERMMGDD